MEAIHKITEWIFDHDKNLVIGFVIIILLLVIATSIYGLKEMIYPSYGSCEEARKELRKMEEKNMPSFMYEYQTEQFNKLCK